MRSIKLICCTSLFVLLGALLLHRPAHVTAQSATRTPTPARATATTTSATPITSALAITSVATVTSTTANTVATVVEVDCTVNVLRLNLRSGPGTEYLVTGQMARDTVFAATLRLADSSWIYGANSDQKGWTAARFLDCAAPVTTLLVDEQFSEPLVAETTATTTRATVTGTVSSGTPTPVTTAQAAPSAAPATANSADETGSDSGAASGAAGVGTDNANTTGGVTLLEPLGEQLYGRQTFRWQSATPLQPNQGYEMVLWEVGQDPLSNGFALGGARPETEINVDLEKLVVLVPQLEVGKEYQWGVVLVQMRPYRRLQFLGGGHRFLLAPTANIGTSADGASAPPPKAPPK